LLFARCILRLLFGTEHGIRMFLRNGNCTCRNLKMDTFEARSDTCICTHASILMGNSHLSASVVIPVLVSLFLLYSFENKISRTPSYGMRCICTLHLCEGDPTELGLFKSSCHLAGSSFIKGCYRVCVLGDFVGAKSY
jgi:hypothetical protein